MKGNIIMILLVLPIIIPSIIMFAKDIKKAKSNRVWIITHLGLTLLLIALLIVQLVKN